jgi:hypothetical protein
MFTTEIRHPAFFQWLVQQFAVPIMSLVWLWLVSLARQTVGKALSDPFREIVEVIYIFAALGFGVTTGFIIHRYFPEAAKTGRWIWIPPMSVFLTACVHDLTRFPPLDVFREFFWPGPEGEAWWAAMLLTYPTWSCASYSLAVALAARRVAGRFGIRPVS